MTTPGRPISARDLNAAESSARTAHPATGSFLAFDNGSSLALRNPRRMSQASGNGSPKRRPFSVTINRDSGMGTLYLGNRADLNSIVLAGSVSVMPDVDWLAQEGWSPDTGELPIDCSSALGPSDRGVLLGFAPIVDGAATRWRVCVDGSGALDGRAQQRPIARIHFDGGVYTVEQYVLGTVNIGPLYVYNPLNRPPISCDIVQDAYGPVYLDNPAGHVGASSPLLDSVEFIVRTSDGLGRITLSALRRILANG